MQEKGFNFSLFIVVATICMVATHLFDSSLYMLIYDNDYQLQAWRFFTAHFIHYDNTHLITNLLAFGILLYLFPATLKSQIFAMIIALVFINVYLCFSSVEYYAGFSGLLYAIPGLAWHFRNISIQKILLTQD